jgi:hypothetical protein
MYLRMQLNNITTTKLSQNVQSQNVKVTQRKMSLIFKRHSVYTSQNIKCYNTIRHTTKTITKHSSNLGDPCLL